MTLPTVEPIYTPWPSYTPSLTVTPVNTATHFYTTTPKRISTVTAEKLRLRSGAGMEYPVMVVLVKGDQVTLLGETKSDPANCTAGWVNVMVNDVAGWVCQEYLR